MCKSRYVPCKLLHKNNCIELGNLSPTRDLTFVKDTCNGFIEIYRSETLFGEVINIGMNEEISIEDLVSLIAKQMGKKVKIISTHERVRPKSSEVESLICDNKKIKVNTRWEPEYSLEKGISETIEWMKKNHNLYKSDQYNV